MPEIQRANATHIEIKARKELNITNVTGLTYSNNTSILLETTDGPLYIEGVKLQIKLFDGKQISIIGEIAGIKFT